MDKREATDIARRFGWLSKAPTEFQDAVLSRCDLMSFKSNQWLYDQGDDATGLYFIAKGKIGFHMQFGGDGPTLAYPAGAGFWGGDLSASTGNPRKMAVRTRTTTHILRLSRASISAIAAKDEVTVYRQLTALMAISYGLALDGIAALRREHPIKRVAAMILNSRPGFAVNPHRIPVNQSELGSITLLSRSTVSSAVTELERRGWIKVKYGVIEILDEDGLREFVSGP
ncbi:MAG: Crp/Fnr family transcriptional regulator [Mesorhizobium sp.]